MQKWVPMSKMRDKYESFIATNELNEGNVHDLLRLCGYSPLDSQQLRVPQCFEDLEKLCLSVKKGYTKEDLLKELILLFGGDTCTKVELKGVLSGGGSKLTESEYESFCGQLSLDEGRIRLASLVNTLMDE